MEVSLAAWTNPDWFLSPFIFLFGKEEGTPNLPLCFHLNNLEDTFSCWSPVCLAMWIVDAVWWESWACWLVPGGQSCCLSLASSSVLLSSSQLWSHLWYSLLSRFSSWMRHRITISSFFPSIGFLPACWALKPGQHFFCYRKIVFLAQVIPALFAEIQNTLSTPSAVGNPTDLAGSHWLLGSRNSLQLFHGMRITLGLHFGILTVLISCLWWL